MRGKAALTWLTIVVVVAGLLIGGGVWLATTLRGVMTPGLAVGCTAEVGENIFKLALDQSENAALIAALAIQRGMPARAASIALATALQESKLRNIDYGDLDSVGLFQQRPSQDWGTVDEIMDPVYSTNAFYDALAQIPDYVSMSLNDAAQLVQRSGYPQAYAQHESLARAFSSALSGESAQGLNCTLTPATDGSSPDVVVASAQQALGALPMEINSATTINISASEATGWMAAQWALANAQQFGIVRISYDGFEWNRDANSNGTNVGWQASEAGRVGQITVTLAPVAGALDASGTAVEGG